MPHTWQSDFIDHPMFRNIPEELWPDDPPKVPHDVNPTGAYVRTIDVPSTWDGRTTFLRFEGATSGYFVWVNGAYVGYDQGGYTPAEFDVTAALRPGANTVAVQVHRWGSGSYLEDVDQWRYSGIFRDVWLYSTPRTRLADLHVTTDLDSANQDATFSARVELARAFAADRHLHRARHAARRGWTRHRRDHGAGHDHRLHRGDHADQEDHRAREVERRGAQPLHAAARTRSTRTAARATSPARRSASARSRSRTSRSR